MTSKLAAALVLAPLGCSSDIQRAESIPVDCSVMDPYEFLNISNFNGSDPQWFRYADPTPGGLLKPDEEPDPMNPQPDDIYKTSDVPLDANDPPRCGDPQSLKIEASGHNFWGTGFGDWGHNDPGSRADGTGYEGISLWAKSARNSEKNFIFNVDEGRTILNPPATPDTSGGLVLTEQEQFCLDTVAGVVATTADRDLDGDGCVGPGDIARGTQCRLPPPEELGDPTCYKGGVNQPSSAGTRVPEADECGNQFHTLIETTEHWQLFFIPWDELVQWPCPNRLDGGIDRADIAKFEIKLRQGTRYEFWIDNIAFYRRR